MFVDNMDLLVTVFIKDVDQLDKPKALEQDEISQMKNEAQVLMISKNFMDQLPNMELVQSPLQWCKKWRTSASKV